MTKRTAALTLMCLLILFPITETAGAQSQNLPPGLKAGPRSPELESVLEILTSESDGQQSVAAALRQSGFDPQGHPLLLTDEMAIFDGSYYFDGSRVALQKGCGFVNCIKSTTGEIRALFVGRAGGEGVDSVEFAFAQTEVGSGPGIEKAIFVLYSRGKALQLRHLRNLVVGTVWPGDASDTNAKPIPDVVGTFVDERGKRVFVAENGERYLRGRLSDLRDLFATQGRPFDYAFVALHSEPAPLSTSSIEWEANRPFSDAHLVFRNSRYLGASPSEAEEVPSGGIASMLQSLFRAPASHKSDQNRESGHNQDARTVTEATTTPHGAQMEYNGTLVFLLPVFGRGVPTLDLTHAKLTR